MGGGWGECRYSCSKSEMNGAPIEAGGLSSEGSGGGRRRSRSGSGSSPSRVGGGREHPPRWWFSKRGSWTSRGAWESVRNTTSGPAESEILGWGPTTGSLSPRGGAKATL